MFYKLYFMASETDTQTSTGRVTAITPTPPPVAIVQINHGEKPEKFLETDFKIWQQKMLFYHTALNLTYFFREDAPTLKEVDIGWQVVAAVDA